MNEPLMQRRQLLGALLASGAGSLPFGALAADAAYPAKPVRLIAPFAAGGVLDSVARMLAEQLGSTWKQSVVVENRTGAGGMIGADLVAKSPPDGLTLLVASTAEVSINQSLYKSMPYVPERDLAPLTLAATTPLALVAAPSLKVNSMADFIALARSQRDRPLSYASAGAGGVQHMAGSLLSAELKVPMSHIPYRGAAPAILDVLSGQVNFMIQSLPLVLPYIRQGRLVPMAVTTPERVAVLPDIPTFNETLKTTGFEILNWYAVFAPVKTPEALQKKLSDDLMAVIAKPEVKAKLAAAGADPVGNTRDEFRSFWSNEVAKYARIVQISGARVE